jgi:hypothetical protein
MDTKALNYVLMNSYNYQKPEIERYNLSRIVGTGMCKSIYKMFTVDSNSIDIQVFLSSRGINTGSRCDLKSISISFYFKVGCVQRRVMVSLSLSS